MPRSWLLALLAPLALAGCLSFSSSDPPPPARTTVVVPQQTPSPPPATVCSPAPCQ